MKRVFYGVLAAALTCVCGLSAQAGVEIPELNGAAITLDLAQPAAAPVSAAQADRVKTLTITVEKKEQADRVVERLGTYLGPRLQGQQIVDRGIMGIDAVLSYTGGDVSGWVTLYKDEDARAGFYYYGRKLTDEQAVEFKARAEGVREEMVKYLESEREWMFFSKPPVKVISSYTTLVRMPTKDMDGNDAELVNPYVYIYVDGSLTDGMRRHLGRNKFVAFATSK